MACFLVPVTEAIVTTVATKIIKNREKLSEKEYKVSNKSFSDKKVPFSRKLSWLNKLLWGGSALLAFEHVWHGEVVPYFPFLTAVKEGETAGMLQEMGTAGVMMAVLVTLIWLIMIVSFSKIENRENKHLKETTEDTIA